MVDVLLVNPPATNEAGPPMEHLGLGYLASALRRDGFSVEIINAPTERLDYAGLAQELSRRHFHVLGIANLFQFTLAPLLKWLESLKAGGLKAHITIGGHPATFTYREILTEFDAVDSVVRGEGEITLVELTRALLAGGEWREVDGIAWRDGDEVILNPSRPLIDDLNALARPARDALIARPRAFEQIVVSYSRGCPANCSFCSIAAFYRSFKGRVWRRRDPEDVLDEIAAAQMIAPREMVFFVDDTFIGPGKIGKAQAFEFAEALARRRVDYFLATSCRADQVDEELFRRLREAGLRAVFLGIESGNEETLRVFDKETTVETNKRALEILRKLDIVAEVGFIMFNPYTTFTNIRRDIEFLLAAGCGPDVRHVGRLTPFSGQPLLAKLEADGLLSGSPFDYRTHYADRRVGQFFEALRQSFSDRAYPAMRAEQLIYASKFGHIGSRSPNQESENKAVEELRHIVYDIINEGADLFELESGGPELLPLLMKKMSKRCDRVLDNAERAIAAPSLTTSY